MKHLGALVLINVLIVSAYFVFATEISAKRVIVFASIGLSLGVAVMLCNRITRIKIPGIAEITSTLEKATADASEVETIRKDVEQQRDSIALIVRDANKGREDLDTVASLSSDAKAKADKLAEVLTRAQETLEDIKTVSEFGLLLSKASNDDRSAFDSLLAIAKDQKHAFWRISNQALIRIITDPQVTGLMTYSIDWKKDHNLDPAQATLDEFAEAYKREVSVRQPTVISALWQQERFPKSKRLQVLYEVIKTTASIRCLHHACKVMNGESKIGKNILAYAEYIEWWEKNRLSYEEQEKAHLTKEDQ